MIARVLLPLVLLALAPVARAALPTEGSFPDEEGDAGDRAGAADLRALVFTSREEIFTFHLVVGPPEFPTWVSYQVNHTLNGVRWEVEIRVDENGHASARAWDERTGADLESAAYVRDAPGARHVYWEGIWYYLFAHDEFEPFVVGEVSAASASSFLPAGGPWWRDALAGAGGLTLAPPWGEVSLPREAPAPALLALLTVVALPFLRRRA